MSLEGNAAEKKSTFNVEVESAEIGGGTPASLTPLSRKLKNRHVAMIRYVAWFPVRARINVTSLGGVIGTGLFLGTASALMNGGPVGMLLGYIFVGTICYSVMVSSSEASCVGSLHLDRSQLGK